MRFAPTMFLKKTHEGIGLPGAPVQRDWIAPSKVFAYIGLPIHAARLVIRWKIKAASTAPARVVAKCFGASDFPKKKTTPNATAVVMNSAGSRKCRFPVMIAFTGYVTSQAAIGIAQPRQSFAMSAPQKNSAASGWKFGKDSGYALPMQRNTTTNKVNNARGR